MEEEVISSKNNEGLAALGVLLAITAVVCGVYFAGNYYVSKRLDNYSSCYLSIPNNFETPVASIDDWQSRFDSYTSSVEYCHSKRPPEWMITIFKPF